MRTNPALDEFQRQLEALRHHVLLAPHVKRGEVRLGALTLEHVAELAKDEASYYFLMAAAGMNRTALKKAAADPAARIVAARLRKAYALRDHLPVRRPFADIVNDAVLLRRGDLERRSHGNIEGLFRERLKEEEIPILMSPPVRQVPGILIGKRKPDGVYPNPADDRAPTIYLEIKNVRRVADDIQKRLYEIAEASLEMKFLYGNLQLQGMRFTSPSAVSATAPEIRAKLRAQITASPPAVVVLLLCAKAEAERYREGAEAFVDKVFFQEEIEECIAYLRTAIGTPTHPAR